MVKRFKFDTDVTKAILPPLTRLIYSSYVLIVVFSLSKLRVVLIKTIYLWASLDQSLPYSDASGFISR